MVRGLYTAFTGMRNEQRRLDVLSNNLANANTNGYKKEGMTSRAFSEVYGVKINDISEASTKRRIGKMSLGVKVGETYRDWSEGSIKTTNNTYDVALTGPGFFTISTTDKSGKTHTRYSRDGEFTVTTDGYLTTKDGDFVLDDGGAKIQIPKTGKVVIAPDSRITVNGVDVAKLGIVDFEDYDYLQQYGENLFDAVDGAKKIQCNTSVEQGLLETSNVNVVQEMVTMITVERSYQSHQKMIQTIDNMLDKSVNSVGKI